MVTLHKFAAFYCCVCPQEPIFDTVNPPDDDKSNKNVAIHIWFANFIDCDRETILAAVDRFKITRGSPNLIRRLPVHACLNDPRTEQGVPSGYITAPEREKAPDPHSHSGSVDHEKQANRTALRRTKLRPPPSSTPSDVVQSDSNESRKATNVFNYLKDNKFTVDLPQSTGMTLRDYNVCARQNRLNARQKADLFINVLAGPAGTFFFNARDDTGFDEMEAMLSSEYNGDFHQLQVQWMLETLCLDKHMSKHEVSSPSEGHSQIIDLLERLTPQCQPQLRSDANKIHYLRKAVMGFSWAMTPIGNITTANYTFNSFVTALKEHIKLENELKTSSNPAGDAHFISDGTYHQQY